MSEGMVESSSTVDGQGGLPAADIQTELGLPFDANKYLSFVEEFDLTLDEKVDLLHTLWKMMSSFADRAWGVDPVQLLPAWREFASAHAPDQLTIDTIATPTFNDTARVEGAEKDEP